MKKFLNHILTAIFVPAFIGFGGAVLCIRGFSDYGIVLFMGLPLLVSFLAAFLWSLRRRQVSFKSAYGVAMLSHFAVGAMVMLVALDGMLCMLMALPLAAVLALIGTALGRYCGSQIGVSGGPLIPLLLCALMPMLAGFEHDHAPGPPVRVVTSMVEIEAPIAQVWDTVIAFPRITEAPTGVFAMGIAYPIEARIEGRGPGALRYCTFSTGSFVEPITVWDAPRHLGFDVIENPPPMREISIYQDLDVPHAHGFMRSQRGQFILSEHDGKTRLEGTTWYTHEIAPQFYWGPISDELIHQIHLRVLNHIKQQVEKQG
jgi:hypothetical protein